MHLINRLGGQKTLFRAVASAGAFGGSIAFSSFNSSSMAQPASLPSDDGSSRSVSPADKKSSCCGKSSSGSPAGTGSGASTDSCKSNASAPPAVPKCRPVILCGPSGAGKSTLISMLRAEFPDDYGFSVSHTTRAPRPGEVDGKDYHFVSGAEGKAKMEADIAAGLFLESANVHGNLYGTSKAAVDTVSAQNRSCILDIDIQGVVSCRKVGFDVAAYIFIAPPSIQSLEDRLRGRGTETEDRIRKRLANAVGEMEQSKKMTWDAYIVNDDKNKAYQQLKEALQCQRDECHKAREAAAHLAAAKAERMKASGCPHAAAAAERAAKLAAEASAGKSS